MHVCMCRRVLYNCYIKDTHIGLNNSFRMMCVCMHSRWLHRRSRRLLGYSVYTFSVYITSALIAAVNITYVVKRKSIGTYETYVEKQQFNEKTTNIFAIIFFDLFG